MTDIAAFFEGVRPLSHIVLHVAVPWVIAWRWGGEQKSKVFLLLMASMLIDLDHLVADPIYAPGRCSIGFHPLHRLPAAVAYACLACVRQTRWFGVGALVHLALDAIDCVMMS